MANGPSASAEAVDRCFDVFKAHYDKPDLGEAMADALTPYKEGVEKSGFTVEQVAQSIIACIVQRMMKSARPKPQLPLRVDVWNGDQSVHLGPGTYVGVRVPSLVVATGGVSRTTIGWSK